MAGIHPQKDEWNTWKTTRILSYVNGLLEDRGGKNIHGGLTEGGPRQLPRGNN